MSVELTESFEEVTAVKQIGIVDKVSSMKITDLVNDIDEFELTEVGDLGPNLDGVKEHVRVAFEKVEVDNAAFRCEAIKRPYLKTGLIYFEPMVEHRCLWDEGQRESPQRFTAILNRFKALDLVNRCSVLPARRGFIEEVTLIHTPDYYEQVKTTNQVRDQKRLQELSAAYKSIYFHPATFEMSLYAVGSTIDLIASIAQRKLKNGFALIRPPGHHALPDMANGYCYFNNVAVAAAYAINKLRLNRILVVDWDIHHGNGTQGAFYEDPRVLVFSVHRYHDASYWPFLQDSNYDRIGEGPGRGFNVNVALNEKHLDNTDYLAIWHRLLLPIAYEYRPEMVIVSAGYDSAVGCPEGEMLLTPSIFAHLTSALMCLAGGRLAVVLEGGYCLSSLSESAAFTLRALLGDPSPSLRECKYPIHESVATSIDQTMSTLRPFWKSLAFDVPRLPPPAERSLRVCDQTLAINGTSLDFLKASEIVPIPGMGRTHLVYNTDSVRHLSKFAHPERPDRTAAILRQLQKDGLLNRCTFVRTTREATTEELRLAHSGPMVNQLLNTSSSVQEQAYPGQEQFTYIRKESYRAATTACGALLELVDNVMLGKAMNGFAIIRPPGHHSSRARPAGFCLINNVAVAAKYALNRYHLSRVLILDVDIHHGNGTQDIVEGDDRLVYISLHKYMSAEGYPYTKEPDMVCPRNVLNVPWNEVGLRDSDYLAAFFRLVLPVAHQFNPELVLLSAGFDAAAGDILEDYQLSPTVYGHLTGLVGGLAGGKVVLALEGGYCIQNVAEASSHCVSALLGDSLPVLGFDGFRPETGKTIEEVVEYQKGRWSSLLA